MVQLNECPICNGKGRLYCKSPSGLSYREVTVKCWACRGKGAVEYHEKESEPISESQIKDMFESINESE
jgi:DnaJ-class molecular chaperone